jgi:hypothetical protein
MLHFGTWLWFSISSFEVHLLCSSIMKIVDQSIRLTSCYPQNHIKVSPVVFCRWYIQAFKHKQQDYSYVYSTTPSLHFIRNRLILHHAGQELCDMIGKFWKLQKSVCFCSLFDSEFFFDLTRRVRKMRHHLKKQHECSYLRLFSFQSNNLFSSGEIFTAANVSLLCDHVFVIHRGRLPRSIGLRIPPAEKVISSSACLLLHR